MGPHLALSPWWQLCAVPESSWWTLTVIRWVWGFVERQNKEGTHHAALINLFNKLPAFHLICPDMHLKPKRRRGSTAEINILILLLITKCKWLFSLLFIHQNLYCGGCSVYTPHREPSVSTILTQKPKKHAETSLTVWIAQVELCLCFIGMITDFLVTKHSGFISIHSIVTHLLQWLSSAAPQFRLSFSRRTFVCSPKPHI